MISPKCWEFYWIWWIWARFTCSFPPYFCRNQLSWRYPTRRHNLNVPRRKLTNTRRYFCSLFFTGYCITLLLHLQYSMLPEAQIIWGRGTQKWWINTSLFITGIAGEVRLCQWKSIWSCNIRGKNICSWSGMIFRLITWAGSFRGRYRFNIKFSFHLLLCEYYFSSG